MSELRPLALDGPAGRLAGWTRGDLGAGIPVLLCHPINTEGRIWTQVAELLAPRAAVMPDLRGHGGADPRGPFSVERWVDDLVAVLDELDLAQVHVVGASIGGAMAVELAARSPERVRSIASFGGTLCVRDDASAFRTLLDEHGVEGTWRLLIPELSVAHDAPKEVVEAAIAIANRNAADVVADVLDAVMATDIRHRAAPARHVPALVVNGSEDRTCPPELGREMAALLGVPAVVMPGVGHLPMLEDPAGTAALIAEHLAAAEAS